MLLTIFSKLIKGIKTYPTKTQFNAFNYFAFKSKAKFTIDKGVEMSLTKRQFNALNYFSSSQNLNKQEPNIDKKKKKKTPIAN